MEPANASPRLEGLVHQMSYVATATADLFERQVNSRLDKGSISAARESVNGRRSEMRDGLGMEFPMDKSLRNQLSLRHRAGGKWQEITCTFPPIHSLMEINGSQ